MHIQPIQLTDVIYNAATQCFEALVSVHDKTGARNYPCAIAAPITMSFDDAAQGLSTQALRRHAGSKGIYSRISDQQQPPVQRHFDPKRWLDTVLQQPWRHAA